MSINGSTAATDHLRLVTFLDCSADGDMVAAWQARIQRRDLRRQRLHDRSGLRSGHDVGLNGHRWPPVPAPDNGIFLAVFDRSDLAERNAPTVRQGHLKPPNRRQRHALLGGGPDHHINQIDSAAHLGGVIPDTTVFSETARVLRVQANQASLVLVDPDPDRPRRLHPVVVDVLCSGSELKT